MPDVYAVSQMTTKYNVNVVTTLKTIAELDNIKNKMKNLPGVLDAKTYIWMNVLNVPENLSILPGQEIEPSHCTPGTVFDLQKIDFSPEETRLLSELDETEVKILQMLSKDSRTPFRKIALEINIAPDTVRRRYENLEKSGIIRSVIQLDPTKIGYIGAVSSTVALEGNVDLWETAEKLSQIPSVVLILNIYGDHELIVVGFVRDVNQQLNIQERIEQIPNLRIVSTVFYRLYNIWPSRLETTSTFR